MRWLTGLLLWGAVSLAQAADLAVGDAFPAMEVEDAHGETHAVPGEARVVLFTVDKAAGEVVTEAFGETEPGTLERAGIAYLADISGMPGLITKMFALPKMRDYPFRVLTLREEGEGADLPRREDRVSIIRLEAGRIAGVEYTDSAEDLRALLD